MTMHRDQQQKLKQLADSFAIVCLIGPRQSGKTTLSKDTFPDHRYISLEDLDNRAFAQEDPRGFLAEYNNRTIIDEAQRVPELFSYMQTKVDDFDTPGQYILTGSAHLSLLEKLTQSLAGRAAILKLLPLTLGELKQANRVETTLHEQLFTGFYPRIYKHNIKPVDWYPNYVQTYLEKDVREMINIKNLQTFQRFIKMCAGRHGQLLDMTALGNDCGISRHTIKEWLSVLEASFLIYFLPPYYNNFSKRLIRSPKLYFYDSGLVCSLLQIENHEQLRTHYLRGAIFEGYVITELLKHRFNQGKEANLYFWREKNGNEVDCILAWADKLQAVEIKSGQSIADDFFKHLTYWQTLTNNSADDCFIIYGGNTKQKRKHAMVLSWQDVAEIMK